jgi:hypothetical protein
MPTGETIQEESPYELIKPVRSLTTGKITGNPYYQLKKWQEEVVNVGRDPRLSGAFTRQMAEEYPEGMHVLEEDRVKTKWEDKQPLLDSIEQQAKDIIDKRLTPGPSPGMLDTIEKMRMARTEVNEKRFGRLQVTSGAEQPEIKAIYHQGATGKPGRYLDPYLQERRPDPRIAAYIEYVNSSPDLASVVPFKEFAQRDDMKAMREEWRR